MRRFLSQVVSMVLLLCGVIGTAGSGRGIPGSVIGAPTFPDVEEDEQGRPDVRGRGQGEEEGSDEEPDEQDTEDDDEEDRPEEEWGADEWRAEAERLRQENANAQRVIGRQGRELGQSREGVIPFEQPRGGGQPSQDPFEEQMAQALSEGFRQALQPGLTLDQSVEMFGKNMARSLNRIMGTAGQHLRSSIEGESRAERAFLSQHPELENEGVRAMFDMTLAGLRAQYPGAGAGQLREFAAKQVVTMMGAAGFAFDQSGGKARSGQERTKVRGPKHPRTRTRGGGAERFDQGSHNSTVRADREKYRSSRL